MSYWKVWKINLLKYSPLICATSPSTMRCVWGALDLWWSKMVWSVNDRHMREKPHEGSWRLVGVWNIFTFFCYTHHRGRYHAHPKFLPFPATHVSIRKLPQQLFGVGMESYLIFQVVLDKSCTWFWKWTARNYSPQIYWKKLSFIERCSNCTRVV